MIQTADPGIVKPIQFDDDILKRYCPPLWSQSAVSGHSSTTAVSRRSNQPNPRPFSRLKKRRRTHPVASVVSHEILSELINKVVSPPKPRSHAQHTTKSIVSDILGEALNRALASSTVFGQCEDVVPDRITSLPHFIADLANKGYLYGIQYCRPFSRRSRYRLSVRVRCLSFKEPQNCKASMTAKLLVNKNVWEVKGTFKHNHRRSKPQPNSWRKRFYAVANSVKRRLQKDEILPHQMQSARPPRPPPSPTSPTSIRIKLPKTSPGTASRTFAARLEPRAAPTAPQSNYVKTVSEQPRTLAFASTPGLVWFTPPIHRFQRAPRSLPLLAPRLPQVFVSPGGSLLFSRPLQQARTARHAVSTKKKGKIEAETKQTAVQMAEFHVLKP